MSSLHPIVALVDVEGHPVPDCQRHTPTCPPDPTDPADWPAWCDNWLWEPSGPTAEDLASSAAFDEAMERFEELNPFPASIEPPDGWKGSAAAGWARMLAEAPPPIAGGSPDDEPGFVPSDEDWADYRSHFDRAEPVYGYE